LPLSNRECIVTFSEFSVKLSPPSQSGIEENRPPNVSSAHEQELHPALRLILGVNGKLASEAQVVEFLRFSLHRGIDTNSIWVAEARGECCGPCSRQKRRPHHASVCAQLYRNPSQHLGPSCSPIKSWTSTASAACNWRRCCWND